jgi:hypothetical protein
MLRARARTRARIFLAGTAANPRNLDFLYRGSGQRGQPRVQRKAGRSEA